MENAQLTRVQIGFERFSTNQGVRLTDTVKNIQDLFGDQIDDINEARDKLFKERRRIWLELTQHIG